MSQDLIISWIRVIITVAGAIAGLTGIIILAQFVAKDVALKTHKLSSTGVAIFVCIGMALGVFVGLCTNVAITNINNISNHKTIVKDEKKRIKNDDGRQMYGIRQAEEKNGIK